MRRALLALLIGTAALGATAEPHCPVTGGTSPRRGGDTAPKRVKRFAAVQRHVELLVVADAAMAQFHGTELQPYLLTVLATAARTFRHGSLGAEVQLRVTRLLVLGPGTPGPPVTSNAAQTLRDFCRWQKDLNVPDEDSPLHFDVAVLFTRQDLCGAATCDTLGMADVGTACDPEWSCAIVEDDGLQSAFTVAHELGHVLSMPHDDSQRCMELNSPMGSSRRVMAPVMGSVPPGEMWSPCSAHFITDFLDNGHGTTSRCPHCYGDIHAALPHSYFGAQCCLLRAGRCLLDKPTEWLKLPSVLPGAAYPADRQCQLAFGPDSRHCGDVQPSCAALWCSGRAGGRAVCQTKHFPWADGTPCALGRVCVSGQCVDMATVEQLRVPVDGSWGPWAPWSSCSRSCGGGVSSSHRSCSRPTPLNGGRFCRGERLRFRSCNVEECPGRSAFREEQCAAYNHRVVSAALPAVGDWVPRYSGVAEEDRCKLMCQSRRLGVYHVLQPRVVDGTPCSAEGSGVCVRGRCIPTGCDRIIGSKKKFDKCMQCGGDGSSCTKVSGSFTAPRYGYNDVITIPAGATHLLVRQGSPHGTHGDNIYLALRKPSGQALLNGGFILVPSEHTVTLPGGAVLRYSGATAVPEVLACRGPLLEPLVLQALVVDEKRPPRLKYSFFIPRKAATTAWEKQKAEILEILRQRRA
ncbi:A disintegrin and metalloproteinase with thrombospondin motifs 4 isoform X1 [Phasianus colchicus]|uniref:A disintegrin and metalloproteinase with thrombospondin motifs 4 isoform X1 n=1 Tax=Phasianus colchicus TaxID=9054 RepID=UPI00129E207F|nr:A disintegrin and metalloproteinase with thrombospondin motifs 4 isoform X1 [Phasianus colchicus]